jgi:ATP-dependent Clp protease adaptor protein ClpS
MSMATPEVKNKIKPDIDIKEPSMYKVIYVNDDQTSMEFVVESLIEHFNYTTQLAVEKTNKVHVEGASSVAVLPYEIAEQKGIEVTLDARTAGYPLQIKIEPTN